MAGRRLVDAAKLFNASKSIAQQHIKLRSQQLDVFTKTSSLAKAAKSQTDRVTLTLEAARVLSQRLNEEIPQYASTVAQRATSSQSADIPRTDTVRGEQPRRDIKNGLEQDHHYDRSGKHTKAEPPVGNELGVKQEKSERSPLPDGTIPSSGVNLEDDTKGQDTFNKRSVPEPPKQPLAEEHGQGQKIEEGMRPIESQESTIPLPGKPAGLFTATQHPNHIPSHANEPYRPDPSPQVKKLYEGHDRDVFYARSVESKSAPQSSPKSQIPKYTEDAQEGDHHVKSDQLNQDVYYSVPEPGVEQVQKEDIPQRIAVPEQDAMPEGINTDVFRTKRVAKLLGGNPYKQKAHLDMRGAAGTPHDHTATAVGHDQDTFNVRTSEQDQPSQPSALRPQQQTLEAQPTTTEKEMHDFAAQLAKDADTAAPVTSDVCIAYIRKKTC